MEGDKYHRDRLGFNSLIDRLGLIDLPLNNQLYTCSHMWTGPSLARLDRAFISDTWETRFPKMWAQTIPHPMSDHTLILFDMGKMSRRRRSSYGSKISS